MPLSCRAAIERQIGRLNLLSDASVISRIESGQHRTGTETLRRLAEALDGHALLGFEFGTESEPARELVAL